MTFTIQPFNAVHTDGIKGLIVPIQQNEFGIDITYDAQPDLKDIEGFYFAGNGCFWVALDEANGNAIGCIALKDIGNAQGALRKMFVAQNSRGKSGVSQALLETLLAHAKKNNFSEIYLGTTVKFLAAHRFYEKNGFLLVDASALPEAFPRMDVDTRFYKIGL